MTPDEVNASQAGNVFMLGAGGVFGEPPTPPITLTDYLYHTYSHFAPSAIISPK